MSENPDPGSNTQKFGMHTVYSMLDSLRSCGILKRQEQSGKCQSEVLHTLRTIQLSDAAGLFVMGGLIGYQTVKAIKTKQTTGPYNPVTLAVKEAINVKHITNVIQLSNMEGVIFEQAKA